VRIIRGHLKTKKLSYPKRASLRPTTDFAKEGLFNVLGHQFEDFEGGNRALLDLCAGLGSISFEWISRDAGHVVAVDNNTHAVGHLIASSKSYGVADKIRVVQSEVRNFLRKNTQKFDFIFADPPYEVAFHAQIIEAVFQHDQLKENGLLVVEHGKRTDLSLESHFLMSKRYGNVVFSFFSL